MPMISTKMSPSEAKEYSGTVTSGDAPAYSYGTGLCLDTELLKKLGFENPPPVGTEFTLMAKVVVTGARSSQEQDGDRRVTSDMQITDMELGAPKKAGPSAADTLYGS